jgi:hypothetical protein
MIPYNADILSDEQNSPQMTIFVQNRLVQAVKPRACILEVHELNLHIDTGYPNRGLSLVYLDKRWNITLIRPRTLPFIFFPNLLSLILIFRFIQGVVKIRASRGFCGNTYSAR